MNVADPSTNTNPQPTSAESEPIPLYDRVVLWMFLVGFILFGIIIVGDLLLGLLR